MLWAPLLVLTAIAASAGPVFISDRDVEETTARITRKEPWTDLRFQELREKADAALGLEVAPQYVYDQKNADNLGSAGARLAAAYRLAGDVRYLEQAKKILLGMARGFKDDNEYITKNLSLDFSVSLPVYVFLYESVASQLTEDERRLASAVLGSAAEAIKKNAYGGPNDPKAITDRDKKQHNESNIRSYHNTAVYLAAAAIGRQDLKDWALNDPSGGFKAHVERSYAPDGLIREGSLHYQLYDLSPMLLLARAAEYEGKKLFEYKAANGNSIKKFLDAPIKFARPDLTAHSTGDGPANYLPDFAALYSTAYQLYKDPVYAHLIGLRKNAVYRSWTAMHEIMSVFMPGPSSPQSPVPGPMIWESGFFMGRQHPGAAFYDLKSNSRWVLLSAQDHDYAHQNANTLDVQLGIGAWPLSVHASRGYLEYADADQNEVYIRSRGYNILTLDGKVPLGAPAFDRNGASASIRFSDKQSGKKVLVQAAEGFAAGAYVKGEEKLSRFVLLAAGPNNANGYVLDYSRITGGSKSKRAGWIWHGPAGAVDEKTSLNFGPSKVDAQDPMYRYVADVREAKPTDAACVLEWKTSDGKAGLATHLVGGRKTEFHLALAAERTPFFYAERAWSDSESGASFVAVHESYADEDSNLRVLGLKTADDSAAVLVAGKRFRDLAAVAPDASAVIKAAHPDDAKEYIAIKGRYGLVRASDQAIDILGDVTETRIKASGIKKAYHNGKSVKFSADDGYARVKLTKGFWQRLFGR